MPFPSYYCSFPRFTYCLGEEGGLIPYEFELDCELNPSPPDAVLPGECADPRVAIASVACPEVALDYSTC